MAQLVAVSDAHRRELAELREAVERVVQTADAPDRGIPPELSARLDALQGAVEGLAPDLTERIDAGSAQPDQTLVAELARMAQLVAVSDAHRREMAELKDAVERLAQTSEAPDCVASPPDLSTRFDALQGTVEGLVSTLTERLIAGSAGHEISLIAELAQMAQLVAVSDAHRRELAELRDAVERIARADNAPSNIGMPPDLSARLDALQGAVEGLAQSRIHQPDHDPEVTRLSVEMAEMAKLVALGSSDRQRIAELHRLVAQRNNTDLTQQIDAIQRDIRRLAGTEPDLANPAWQRDRIARRRAEAEVGRLQDEMLLLSKRVESLQVDLDAARQSRRKLKKALKQQAYQAKRQLARAQQATGVRHWVRAAKMARPVGWLYRRLGPRR